VATVSCSHGTAAIDIHIINYFRSAIRREIRDGEENGDGEVRRRRRGTRRRGGGTPGDG
jgi:hypothetical protein